MSWHCVVDIGATRFVWSNTEYCLRCIDKGILCSRCKAVVTLKAHGTIKEDVPGDTVSDPVMKVVETYLHVRVILLTEIRSKTCTAQLW